MGDIGLKSAFIDDALYMHYNYEGTGCVAKNLCDVTIFVAKGIEDGGWIL